MCHGAIAPRAVFCCSFVLKRSFGPVRGERPLISGSAGCSHLCLCTRSGPCSLAHRRRGSPLCQRSRSGPCSKPSRRQAPKPSRPRLPTRRSRPRQRCSSRPRGPRRARRRPTAPTPSPRMTLQDGRIPSMTMRSASSARGSLTVLSKLVPSVSRTLYVARPIDVDPFSIARTRSTGVRPRHAHATREAKNGFVRRPVGDSRRRLDERRCRH